MAENKSDPNEDELKTIDLEKKGYPIFGLGMANRGKPIKLPFCPHVKNELNIEGLEMDATLGGDFYPFKYNGDPDHIIAKMATEIMWYRTLEFQLEIIDNRLLKPDEETADEICTDPHCGTCLEEKRDEADRLKGIGQETTDDTD